MLHWDVLYLCARGWGIQPSEFWSMTMSEWYCEYEHNADLHGTGTYAGNLTRGDVDELSERAELTNEEWLNQNALA